MDTPDNIKTSPLLFNPPKISLRNELQPKPIFRETTDFRISGQTVGLLATDKPSIVTDSTETGHLVKQKSNIHKRIWKDLNKHMVVICVKDDTTSVKKTFSMCFWSFICLCTNPSVTIENMKITAQYLADSWNTRNSARNQRYKRVDSTQIVPVDVRCEKVTGTNKLKNIELVLAGTTWYFNNGAQNKDAIVNCLPENVHFQLRFQRGDANPVSGMLTLTLTDWIDFLSNPKLTEFSKMLYSEFSLPENYVEKIEKYYANNEINENVNDTDNEDSFFFKKQTNSTEEEAEDNEEDDNLDDPTPLPENLKKRKSTRRTAK